MTDDNQPKKSHKIRNTLLWISLNIVLMFAIVGIVSFYVMPGWLSDITGHEQRVTVPAVVGLTADEAELLIQEQGLRPMVIDTVFSDGHLPGVVLEQLPEGKLPVKPGRIVYLTINSYTTQEFPFPDIEQLSSRQAISELEDQYYVVDSIILEPYEFDDLVLSVDVVGRDKKAPKVGEMFAKRTHVVLHVGSTTVEVEGKTEETEDAFFE